jgi:hypothetical protein
MRNLGWLVAAAVAGLVLAGGVRAGEVQPGKKGAAAARGQVSKVDKAAKTFVVTNKKRGDTTVAYSDKTVFKKAPATGEGAPVAATVDDLKVGTTAQVMGKMENGKVVATQVVVGVKRRKKAGL